MTTARDFARAVNHDHPGHECHVNVCWKNRTVAASACVFCGHEEWQHFANACGECEGCPRYEP